MLLITAERALIATDFRYWEQVGIEAGRLAIVQPAGGNGYELLAIGAVIIGGASTFGGEGSIIATLIGAIIIGILDKGLNQAGVHYSLQYIVKGAVILAAVYLDVRRRK